MGVRADVVVGDRLRISRQLLQVLSRAVASGQDHVVVTDARRDEETQEVFLQVQQSAAPVAPREGT